MCVFVENIILDTQYSLGAFFVCLWIRFCQRDSVTAIQDTILKHDTSAAELMIRGGGGTGPGVSPSHGGF